MEPAAVGLVGLGVLFVLIAIGLPIAVAFLVVGLAGAIYLAGLLPALNVLATVAFTWTSNYVLMAIPLFILMGYFSFRSGISEELYWAAHRWLGRLPGGLAIATTVAAGGFAATSGSSVATAGAMGAVAIPEMRKHGYAPGFAAGCCAAGGTLGILIPPSIGFIVYGAITEESVGKLFLAGYFPGLLEIAVYSLLIIFMCQRNPSLGPPGKAYPWKERFAALRSIIPMLLLIVLVMGGIFMGVFTPTEAGAVGAFGAFLIALGRRRLNRNNLASSLSDTGLVTAMLFLLFVGGMVFSYFLAISGLPKALGQWLIGSGLPLYVMLSVMLFIYLVLGTFMEPNSMIVLTLPLFLVALKGFDVNLIWFGVLTVRMIEIGLITPPVGLNVFTIRGIAPDIPLGEIFKGILPFVGADLAIVALLVAFPQISLFLPNLMTR